MNMIALTVNRRAVQARRRAAHHPRGFRARQARPDRHASRLRARRLRRLHGAARWRAGALLHHLCRGLRRRRGHHDRRPRRGRGRRELRAAFTREHALQCGYCTPGMLVSARDLVLRLPDADERVIRVGMSGNLCRCTGYVGIVRAVQSVIEARRARDIAPEPDGGRKILGPVGSGRSVHRRLRPRRTSAAAGSEQTTPRRPVRSARSQTSRRPLSWSSISPSRIRPNRSLRCSATSQPSRPVCPARR